MTQKPETFVTTVAFVGQPNVGKSTLLNALVGAKIAPTTRKAQTTRRIIRGIKTIGQYQQIYFDTPGVLRKETGLDHFMHDQIFQALSNVEQVVAITDAKDKIFRHIEFLKTVKQSAEQHKQVFTLVINKIDELRNKAVLLELISQYTEELGAIEIIPVSATKHDGLQTLFDSLNKAARPSPFLFSPEFFTDASEKEIVAELIREKAMLELNEELPYRLAVTIDHFDEARREDTNKPLIEIEAVIHVERKSQKAIVIGKGGAEIKAIGIRARKEIENLLQCQVMLKLFVRVEPNWTTSPKGLRKLGY
jgi:GTP-binding protein Era